MTTARWLFLAAVLAPLPAAALEQPPCLSRGEVKGGYPRYHVIDGRQCWYAATSPAAKPGTAKPDAPEPTAAADETDVNPYGDPIWRQSGARIAPRKPRRTKPSAVGGPLILNPSSAYAR
jgi:hypothetical protein